MGDTAATTGSEDQDSARRAVDEPLQISTGRVRTRIWEDREPIIRRIVTVVAAGYIPVGLSHFVFLENLRGQLICFGVAMTCSLALAWSARRLGRESRTPNSYIRHLILLYACVALHSLVRLFYSHTPGDMMFVGALTVALALVPSPQRIHALAVGIYVTGWSATIVALFDLQTWASYIAPLIVTTVVSLVIRALEIRRERDLAELRLVDDARRNVLEHEARHDALTGMANRALFQRRVERALARARGGGATFALLYLDLDRFKVVNDSLGHAVGDRLLKAVGRRLTRFVRPGDTVARFGGDEFGVLLERLGARSDAIAVVERLEQVLDEPFVLDRYDVHVGASIGIALFQPEYENVADMLRDADIAMYAAKRGRDSHHLFDAEMHAQAVARLEIEVELRGALKQEEQVVPWYQPLVDLGSGRVVGFEALARWQHPDRGVLTPGDFLEIAEETGIIYDLGATILRKAIRDFATTMRSTPSPPDFVSVNVSAREFARRDFEASLSELLHEFDVDPGQLWLEITESSVLEQPVAASARLERLRALGVRIAIDDFGVGYSSLSYLQRLPFDVLKLDRSFLAGDQSETLIRAVTQLASSLSMVVVAEGIEAMSAVSDVRALGCALGQGWALGRPMPLSDALDFSPAARAFDGDAHDGKTG